MFACYFSCHLWIAKSVFSSSFSVRTWSSLIFVDGNCLVIIAFACYFSSHLWIAKSVFSSSSFVRTWSSLIFVDGNCLVIILFRYVVNLMKTFTLVHSAVITLFDNKLMSFSFPSCMFIHFLLLVDQSLQCQLTESCHWSLVLFGHEWNDGMFYFHRSFLLIFLTSWNLWTRCFNLLYES